MNQENKTSYSAIELPPIKPKIIKTKKTGSIYIASIFFILISLFGIRTFIHSNANVFQIDQANESIVDLIKELPSSQLLHEFFEYYAAHSQLPGSQKDLSVAEWTRDQLTSFGLLNATVEPFYPFLNYPVHRELAIVSGPQELLFQAKLDQVKDSSPSFHAYSADGNVTGSVIYANYGRLEDFDNLVQNQVRLEGTIALIRHGKIPASIKVQHAESFGCIGVLIYTDDNKISPNFVERESVQYGFFYPGDPFTPGLPADNITQSDRNQTNLPTIPSLPISWSNALPLFRATQGLGFVDPDWIGDFKDVSYFSGPSIAQVRLVNLNDYRQKPIWNVLARIEGHEEKEKAIVIGNARDSWVDGNANPSSGSAIFLELARVFGLLVQQGWKPRRSIIFASWDAQTVGNVGSTEHVESHSAWLNENAVAYLNIDCATGTRFEAEGSPLLIRLIYQVTSMILHPTTGLSVYYDWLNKAKQKPLNDLTPPVAPPSTLGSDTLPFFQHAGISTLSLGFKNKKHGSYNSIPWMEGSGDPTFEYHQTLVKIWGLVAYYLSDDVVLPFSTVDYVNLMKHQLGHLAADNRTFTTQPHRLITSLDDLHKTTLKFERQAHQLKKKNHKKTKWFNKVRQLNQKLLDFERTLASQDQFLLHRPWYRHAIYGPSAKTGLIEVFPGLLESVELGTFNQTDCLYANILNHAQILLKKKSHGKKLA